MIYCIEYYTILNDILYYNLALAPAEIDFRSLQGSRHSRSASLCLGVDVGFWVVAAFLLLHSCSYPEV